MQQSRGDKGRKCLSSLRAVLSVYHWDGLCFNCINHKTALEQVFSVTESGCCLQVPGVFTHSTHRTCRVWNSLGSTSWCGGVQSQNSGVYWSSKYNQRSPGCCCFNTRTNNSLLFDCSFMNRTLAAGLSSTERLIAPKTQPRPAGAATAPTDNWPLLETSCLFYHTVTHCVYFTIPRRLIMKWTGPPAVHRVFFRCLGHHREKSVKRQVDCWAAVF